MIYIVPQFAQTPCDLGPPLVIMAPSGSQQTNLPKHLYNSSLWNSCLFSRSLPPLTHVLHQRFYVILIKPLISLSLIMDQITLSLCYLVSRTKGIGAICWDLRSRSINIHDKREKNPSGKPEGAQPPRGFSTRIFLSFVVNIMCFCWAELSILPLFLVFWSPQPLNIHP